MPAGSRWALVRFFKKAMAGCLSFDKLFSFSMNFYILGQEHIEKDTFIRHFHFERPPIIYYVLKGLIFLKRFYFISIIANTRTEVEQYILFTQIQLLKWKEGKGKEGRESKGEEQREQRRKENWDLRQSPSSAAMDTCGPEGRGTTFGECGGALKRTRPVGDGSGCQQVCGDSFLYFLVKATRDLQAMENCGLRKSERQNCPKSHVLIFRGDLKGFCGFNFYCQFFTSRAHFQNLTIY